MTIFTYTTPTTLKTPEGNPRFLYINKTLVDLADIFAITKVSVELDRNGESAYTEFSLEARGDHGTRSSLSFRRTFDADIVVGLRERVMERLGKPPKDNENVRGKGHRAEWLAYYENVADGLRVELETSTLHAMVETQAMTGIGKQWMAYKVSAA